MTHSIEARLPFLDYRFVEYIISLPNNQKIKDGVTKSILRDSLRGIVSDRKDKMGFVTPEEVWAKENKDFFRAELKKAVEKSKYINQSILNEFEEFLKGKKSYNPSFWRIITYSNWME